MTRKYASSPPTWNCFTSIIVKYELSRYKFFRLRPCKKVIKRYKVREKYANILRHIQFINEVSQMSYIYHQVSILVYKILIKKHMYYQ